MLAGQLQLVSVPAATVLLPAVLPQLLKKPSSYGHMKLQSMLPALKEQSTLSPSSWVHSVSVQLVDLAGISALQLLLYLPSVIEPLESIR